MSCHTFYSGSAEQAYPKLIHLNEVAKGGHFAAWEQPEIFAEEVRTGFRSLRPSFTSMKP